MTSGENNFTYFAKKLLTKFNAVQAIKAKKHGGSPNLKMVATSIL